MEQNLLKYIEERMPAFSKGQRLIASYVLEHYDRAAYMTASKLGALVKVSESTVVRFAIELGFDGYPALRRSLQEFIRNRLTTVQRMEVTNNLIGDGDILRNVLLSDAEKIKHTLENVDRGSFDRAVDKIIAANNVYIMGVRSSSSLANFLNFNLSMIREGVQFVQTTSESEIFEKILRISKNDVMIAISFPRYSNGIINAVGYAKESGADVIALTDGTSSPIAAHADELLIAKSDMASFVDSLVAPLSIINALIVAISKKKQDELNVVFEKLEHIWDEYNVYDKSHG